MEYKAPLETYTGRVKEVTLGKGAGALKIGGGNILPLHYFEGSTVHRPLVALEVNDNGADRWAEWVVQPYKDVVSDNIKAITGSLKERIRFVFRLDKLIRLSSKY